MIATLLTRSVLPLIATLALGVGSALQAADQTIGTGQTPLEATVQDGLNIQTYRNIGDEENVSQYYSGTGYDTFLVLGTTAGAPTVYSGGSDDSENDGDPLANLTPVSNVYNGTANTITTVVTAAPGITITHVLTYTGGNTLQHTWTILNSTETLYPTCALRYGGDTYFNDNDHAAGFYDAATQMVYSVDPQDSYAQNAGGGVMGLYADGALPATSYYEDQYGLVNSWLMGTTVGQASSVNATYVDNGTGLEWNLSGGLSPQSQVVINAVEVWDDENQVVVEPAAATTVGPATPTVIPFFLTNAEDATDVFTLLVQASPGITIDGYQVVNPALTNPASVSMVSGATIEVDVTVSGSAALESDATTTVVSLLAQSQSNASYLDAGATQITVTALVQVSPPAETDYVATSPETAQFQIANYDSITHTYTVSTQAPSGIAISNVQEQIIQPSAVHLVRAQPSRVLRNGPGTTVTIDPGNYTYVNVDFTASSALAGTTVPLTMTATAQDNSAITDTESALLDIVGVTAPVQVIAPQASTYAANSSIPLTFTIYNLEGSGSDTFALTATASSGLTIADIVPASPVQISSEQGDNSLQVTVDVLAGSIGNTASVTLTATSTITPADTSSASAVLSFPPPTAPATTPGVATTVPAQTVPTSTNGHIVFFPISPSTGAGVDALLATLGGLGPNAVAYAWDASVQGYTLLPAQPTGGLLPTSGVFVATALPFTVDFSGASTQAPAPIALQPGWNLIGIPPTDLGGTPDVVRTTHHFPGDFTLLDPISGQPVTSIATVVQYIGDPATTDITTAYPYYYNGTTYTQLSTLVTGTAYWIKNNTALPLYLESVASGSTILSAAHSQRSAATYHGTITNRGTPPALPAAKLSGGSGGGCGASSGAGLVLMLAFFLYRRRAI